MTGCRTYELRNIGAASVALLMLSGCSPVVEVRPRIPYGGRAVAITVETGTDPYLLVASETGGLFRSTDAGLTWTHVEGLPSAIVSDVAFSPTNGNIVLATTRDDFLNAPNGGIWRSTDAGRTWSRPPGSVPPAGLRCPDRTSAYGISFSTSAQVVVGTDCGVAIGSAEGASWSHVVINAAAPITAGRLQNRVLSVLALPGARIYAAGADGIAVSPDGGGTWIRAADPPRAQDGVVHGLAASPFNVDHVFLVSRTSTEVNVLFSSVDAARTWTQVRSGDPNPSRAGFVRTARAANGVTNAFDLYFGGGVRTRRSRFTNGSIPTGGTFQELSIDHADPADVVFSRNGRTPLLLATDGGLHRTSDDGATWTLTGSGAGGYGALQITEVTGQMVTGSSSHVDLYFATQDNSIWASPDGSNTWPASVCCEGFHLRTPRRAEAHDTRVVTGGRCGPPCTSWLADSHLANVRQWPNAPDGDADTTDDQGIPFLIRPRVYVQQIVNNDVDPPEHRLMLTTNTGTSWVDRGRLPDNLLGRPVVAGGTTSTPVLYNATRRAGVNADGSPRLGLVRIENLFGPGDIVVTDADATLGGLGTFPTMFAWYRVFGVDPSDSNRLLVPDIVAGEMKSSVDGGRTWTSEPELTSLLTNSGTYRFSMPPGFSLVSAIDWDPDNPCHVLVGTRQSGVLRSIDRGATWTKVEGSERLTNLSSFFFQTTKRVWASTYGRGLWRLRLSATPATCGPVGRRPLQADWILEVWEMTHARQPFEGPGKPPICPQCTYLLVYGGEVTSIDIAGATVREVRVSGGLVRHVNQQGGLEPLPSVVVGASADVKAGPDVFAAIRQQKVPIRGIVLERGEIRGFIAGRPELARQDIVIPVLRLSPRDATSGDAIITAGQRLGLRGSGFQSGGAAIARLDDRIIVERIPISPQGEFRVEVSLTELPGDHVIDVMQVDKDGLRAAREWFKVVPQSADRK